MLVPFKAEQFWDGREYVTQKITVQQFLNRHVYSGYSKLLVRAAAAFGISLAAVGIWFLGVLVVCCIWEGYARLWGLHNPHTWIDDPYRLDAGVNPPIVRHVLVPLSSMPTEAKILPEMLAATLLPIFILVDHVAFLTWRVVRRHV